MRLRQVWSDSYNDPEPQGIEEAAKSYAEWADCGRQGELAKATAFYKCKEYGGEK